MKGSLSTAFQYLTYLGYRLFVAAGGCLSLSGCQRIGSILGRIAWLVAPPYRRVVCRNLRIAFEGEKEESEIRTLGRRHFERLFSNFLLSIKFSTMNAEAIESDVVTYEGLDHIATANAAGKGIILAISHLGPWELFSQLKSLAHGPERSAIYRALNNRFIDEHVVAQRARVGLKLFDRSSGVFGPLRHLRKGGAIGILIDQHTGDHGIWCPFFGRLSATTNLPALLSLRTGAVIVSTSIHTDPEKANRWRIVYQTPHIPPAEVEDLPGATADLTMTLNRELEASIRKAPEEWFWVHNRWKTPNPHLLLAKSPQTIAIPEEGPPLKPFRLLLRSPNPLGDACMAIPAVRAIKKGRPDLHLTILCRENLEPVWRCCPEVDEVLPVSRSDSASAVGRIVRDHASHDAAVLFPNSLSSAAEAWFSGIPRIIGYRGHWRRKLLKQVVSPSPVGPPRHHARSYLRIAEAIGADIESEAALVDDLSHSRTSPNQASATESLHLGICPGAEYGAAKRWPEDRFATVINGVQEKLPCRVTLFGSPNEKTIGETLAGLVKGDCDNRVGQTSLTELIEGLRECDAVISNDTGTMHLAAMLGVPTIAIFGSTEPLWTRPLGNCGHRVIRKHVECSPCFLRECPIDFRCMKEIDPEDALAATLEVLGR